MKTKLKSTLLLIVITFIFFSACKKRDALPTTIHQVSLEANKDDTQERGTFTATGGINTTGHFVMDIKLVGTDSFYCTNKLIATEGSFTTSMHCSMITNTGAWRIIEGTGRYAFSKGSGTLVMSYPPGVVGVEDLTGKVFLDF